MFEQYKKCSASLTLEKQNEALKWARKPLSPKAKAAQNEARKEARKLLSPEVKAAQNQEKNEAWRKALNSLSQKAKSAQNQKRNEAQNKARKSAAQDKNSAADAYLEDLASRILDMVDISKADIDFMADEQRFARHPNLALTYYHLCSSHPDAFVFNDECLNGEEGEKVCKRLMEAIGPPIGKTEAVQCQESATVSQYLCNQVSDGYKWRWFLGWIQIRRTIKGATQDKDSSQPTQSSNCQAKE